MPVTRQLLARLRNLDDLIELAAELGYQPQACELNPLAQRRLGLDVGALGTRRAAIVGRAGSLALYGILAADPSRRAVADCASRLAQATAGAPHLLIALDTEGTTLVCAGAAGENGARSVRQLRLPLHDPSPVALDILRDLSVKPQESTLGLATRLADALTDEGLTRRFFREFRRLHARAAQRLTGAAGAGVAERSALVLVILTRVLFLYFVQAKGWLAGRSDFLPSLLDTALGRGHPFHHHYFEPLCFGALNVPHRERSPAVATLGELPFLNGGLFERHPLERRFPAAALPDDMWRELFDELFERFHFTVRESESADAVDPEMLGRVFEGLMGAPRRRRSGTYYTPRPLVRGIVSRALRAVRDGSGGRCSAAVRILDPAVGSGAFLLEALHQLEAERGPLRPGESAASRRRAIVRDHLFGVDTDPMAVRLAELRLWLAMVVDDDAAPEDVAPLPNLDWNLRQGDSLLSPLDGGAWTAATPRSPRRAVAERKARYYAASGREKALLARSIRAEERHWALEAADAAIRTLSARIEDAAAASGRDLFGDRSERGPAARQRVAAWRRQRREVVALRRRIADEDALPFFSYDIQFGEACADGGFDIVLGNPPWVRGESLPATLRTALARRYDAWRSPADRAGFAHLPDLSVAFVERALELVRPGGVIALLLPSKLLRARYAARLRALLRREATVLYVGDHGHARRTGFAATVFPMVLALRRGPPTAEAPVEVALAGARGRVLRGVARQRDLAPEEAGPGAAWLALPGDLVQAVRSALQAAPPLRSRFRPCLGVKTGANDVFLRPLSRAAELPITHRAPALLGRDVAPFRLEPSFVVLAVLDASGKPLEAAPPDVRAYLEAHADRLRRRSDARAPVDRPWALFRTDLLRGEWSVVWRDIAPRLEAAVLQRGGRGDPVPLNTCYGTLVPDARSAFWLAAFLNSRVLRGLAAALADRASGGAFRFSGSLVGALPVPPDPDAPSVRTLEAMGREATRGEPTNPDDLDETVASALGLDADTASRLRFLCDALCRDPGRDR
jgi:hypothetical protein